MPWQLVQVNAEFDVISIHEPDPSTRDGRYGAYPPIMMTPLGSGYLAFGDVTEEVNKEGEYYSAFTYFDLNDELVVLENTKVKVGTELRDRYSLTFMPFIAANEEAGFVLFLGDNPVIGRYEPGDDHLEILGAFPVGVKPRPSLNRERCVPGTWQATLFYKQMEAESFAAAIYSRTADDLYLLVREAIGRESRASWYIISLDPYTGDERYRKQLPTDAAHLNVVPGKENWVLIEKSYVRPVTSASAPYMPVESMVVLPSDWIETAYGGRLQPARPTFCSTRSPEPSDFGH